MYEMGALGIRQHRRKKKHIVYRVPLGGWRVMSHATGAPASIRSGAGGESLRARFVCFVRGISLALGGRLAACSGACTLAGLGLGALDIRWCRRKKKQIVSRVPRAPILLVEIG